MAYGRIVVDLTRSGGAGTTATVTHNLGTATHCTFGVQDITTAGAIRTYPRFWTSTKGADADTITDDTAAGACSMSFMSVAAHSLIDVGPITAGITRTVVSPFVTTTNPGARSLHTGVVLTLAGNAAATPTVTITHGLQTANVIVIVFPTTSPAITTAGGARPLFVVQNVGAATATTCQIQGQTQDAVVDSTGNPTAVTFDVMVLARKPTNAPWSRIMRRHGQGTPFVAGDDYGAGDRAQTGALPSYGAMYTNIDDLAVAPGGAYTHNIGASTLLLALFEQTVAVGAAYNTMCVTNRATSTTTATLSRGNELAGVTLDARVAFFRPYSVICLPT
jgi:hypothetical protein